MRTDGGTEELAMQEWFVRERAEPPVIAVHFAGADDAPPAPGVLEAIATAETILVCPSNPVISIGPILAVPGVRDALVRRRDRVVGVSPIIAGAPGEGPGRPAHGPARHRRVVRRRRPRVRASSAARSSSTRATPHRAAEVEAAGVHAVVADTLMTDARVAAALARAHARRRRLIRRHVQPAHSSSRSTASPRSGPATGSPSC